MKDRQFSNFFKTRNGFRFELREAAQNISKSKKKLNNFYIYDRLSGRLQDQGLHFISATYDC